MILTVLKVNKYVELFKNNKYIDIFGCFPSFQYFPIYIQFLGNQLQFWHSNLLENPDSFEKNQNWWCQQTQHESIMQIELVCCMSIKRERRERCCEKTEYFSVWCANRPNFVFHILLGNLRFLKHIILYVLINPKVLLNIHTAS